MKRSNTTLCTGFYTSLLQEKTKNPCKPDVYKDFTWQGQKGSKNIHTVLLSTFRVFWAFFA